MIDLEKMKLEDINPDTIEKMDDKELVSMHRRTHQWFVNARQAGRTIEPIQHAHDWMVEEMKRREFEHNTPIMDTPVQKDKYTQLKGIVVVSDYVSIVGSTARGDPAKANDLDIVVRDDADAPHFWHENLFLVLRRYFDPEKTGKKLHIIFNPQGPHEGNYIPVFDLVLRDNPEDHRLVKAASAMPAWRSWVKGTPDGMLVDIGPGEARAEGFIGMGRDDGCEIYADLEQFPWPLSDNSIAVLRANHVLEHLANSTKSMEEIYRVLAPKGIAVITVPSTSGEGAFAHPEHKTFWNKSSFAFWTQPDLAETIEGQTDPRTCFDLEYLADRRVDVTTYTDAVLRKPEQPVDPRLFKIEKSYSRARCMECSKPPAREYLWAEGMAHAWFCTEHARKFELEHKGHWEYKDEYNEFMEHPNDKTHYVGSDIDVTRVVRWGVASDKFREPITQKEAEEYLATHKVVKRALQPIATFQAPHPSQRGRGQTDAYALGELWGWVEDKLKKDVPVTCEPKLNGFRSIAQSDGKRVSIKFEGGGEKYPILVRADPQLRELEKLPPFIIDCNIGITYKGGRIAPRPDLMTLQAGEPKLAEGAHITLTAFDLLYWYDDSRDGGASINELPFSERRQALEKWANLLGKSGVGVTKSKAVKTKADLATAWASKAFGSAPMVEGLVIKDGSWEYEPGPVTNGMVKIKHTLEVKARVIEAKTLKNGKRSYRGGLVPGEAKVTNLKDFKGKQYVDMGFSFNTDIKASEGDTVTFQVDEVIWNEPDGHMAWLGAVALDVDKTRGPYAAGQVLDMAERSGTLQHTMTKALTTRDFPPGSLTIEPRIRRKKPWEIMKENPDVESQPRDETGQWTDTGANKGIGIVKGIKGYADKRVAAHEQKVKDALVRSPKVLEMTEIEARQSAFGGDRTVLDDWSTVHQNSDVPASRAAGFKTVEEYHSTQQSKLRSLTKDGEVWVRVPPESLNGILDSGELRTSYDTGRSGGSGRGAKEFAEYQGLRSSMERDMYGSDTHPIYGYVQTDPDGAGASLSVGDKPLTGKIRDSVDGYGTARILLNADVKGRTTIVVGDSLSTTAYKDKDLQPSPFNSPSYKSVPVGMNITKDNSINNLMHVQGAQVTGVRYVEAQVHGGVQTKDIREVVFRGRADPTITSKLDGAGIKWRTTK